MVPKKSRKIKSPTITVVMPAYNAEKYIAEAIDSILMQTFKNFELLIIDDASKDNTWSIIKKYQTVDKRITALRNKKNLKLSKTLNIAINQSKGSYIARMDADDLSYPDRLKKQYNFLRKNKNVGIVGGSMEIIKENGEISGMREYPLTDILLRKKIFWFSPFSHPLIMVRKSVLAKSGLYNHIFNPAEDYELYFRIGKFSKFANLADTLLRYRVIDKSMTTGSTKKMELQTIRIRSIYAKSKGYNMTNLQKIYNLIHLITLYLVPSGLKMKVFNFLRNT